MGKPHLLTSLSSSQLEEFVKDREILCVEDQDVFNRVYSLVHGYTSLPNLCKLNLVESLRSNLAVLLPNVDSLLRVSNEEDDHILVIDCVASHRNTFKIYTYFLLNIVLAEDSNNAPKVVAASATKKQPGHSWNWEPLRARNPRRLHQQRQSGQFLRHPP